MRSLGGLLLILGCAAGLVGCERQSTEEADQVEGRVLSDGAPVAGATVRIQATDRSTVTAEDGTFALALPDSTVRLTAWAPGYFCGGPTEAGPGRRDVEIALVPHPVADNPGYRWVSAYARMEEPAAGVGREGVPDEVACERCHSREDDSRPTLPFDEWVLDAHAGSAVNPRVLTMYAGTDVHGNRSPPTRYVDSRDYGRRPLLPDPGQPYFGPGYRLDFPDSGGNCGACHAPMAAVDGAYGVDLRALEGVEAEGVGCDFCHKVWDVRLGPDGIPAPNRPGVLSFELRRPPDGHQFFAGPRDDVAPGEDTFAPVQRESRFCAPCHFGVFWGVTVYNSFGEWLASPYSRADGQTCQDCHMPPRAVGHFARLDRGGLPRDPGRSVSHRMRGVADVSFLQETTELVVDAVRDGAKLNVTTRLTNARAGHHVPTGSPLRQMLLTVVAADAYGHVLPLRSGAVLPDWAGDLAGTPGRFYAKLLREVWTGRMPTGAYWVPTRTAIDTRLPALTTDTAEFAFDLATSGRITVDVQVVFRRAFHDLASLKGWTDPDVIMAREVVTLPESHAAAETRTARRP